MARKQKNRLARRAVPKAEVRRTSVPFPEPRDFPEPRHFMVAEAFQRAEKLAGNLEGLLKEIARDLAVDRVTAWQKEAVEYSALQLVSLRLQLRGHQQFYLMEVGRG